MEPQTNLPPQLTPSNSSFGLRTVRERWPVIIAQVIDSLYRNRIYYSDTLGIPAESLKSLTGAIGELRYEVTTDKPLTLLHTDLVNQEELEIWNRQLQALGVRLKQCDNLKEFPNDPSWHNLPWLITECYLYRRIMDCAALNGLGSFDPFTFKKEAGLKESQSLVQRLLTCLDELPSDPTEAKSESWFQIFIHASLWANEFDLSLRPDGCVNVTVSLLEHIKSLSQYLVVNNTRELFGIWSSRLSDRPISSAPKTHTVALVLDNSGPELVADLCLAEYLIASGFTSRVAFYPKIIPWYVSDVTERDITWLLDVGLSSQFLDESLVPLAKKWAEKWRSRFSSGQFVVRQYSFWTYLCPYEEMATVDPKLHEELTTGVDVILFKGDYNYRKLVADRTWRSDCVKDKQTAFRRLQFGRPVDKSGRITCTCSSSTGPGDPLDCRCQAPSGQTWPPLMCSLRIAKCDVAVGLTPETLKHVQAESSDWWIIGRYGFIQVVSPIQM